MRSPILLIISCALLGCPNNSSETCGAGSNAGDLDASGSGIATMYTALTSNENHDCVAPNTPDGIVALTIDGTDVGGGAGLVTLCIPRPDLLATETMGLANISSAGSDVQIVDLTGSASAGCTFALDGSAAVSGTISAAGLCGEGSAGYALTLNVTVSVDVTCGSGSATAETVTLSGTVAVAGS
ncbi:MAG TPA: hypothetical protein VGG28_10115 [Kofleriaceae bacterium]